LQSQQSISRSRYLRMHSYLLSHAAMRYCCPSHCQDASIHDVSLALPIIQLQPAPSSPRIYRERNMSDHSRGAGHLSLISFVFYHTGVRDPLLFCTSDRFSHGFALLPTDHDCNSSQDTPRTDPLPTSRGQNPCACADGPTRRPLLMRILRSRPSSSFAKMHHHNHYGLGFPADSVKTKTKAIPQPRPSPRLHSSAASRQAASSDTEPGRVLRPVGPGRSELCH